MYSPNNVVIFYNENNYLCVKVEGSVLKKNIPLIKINTKNEIAWFITAKLEPD